MSKYYTTTDIIKMLPYIKGYSKDIKKYYDKMGGLIKRILAVSRLISMDDIRNEKIIRIKNHIRRKIFQMNRQIDRWEAELKELCIQISDIETGRLSIPARISWLTNHVVFCILPQTTREDIEWHFETESYDGARRYFEHTV